MVLWWTAGAVIYRAARVHAALGASTACDFGERVTKLGEGGGSQSILFIKVRKGFAEAGVPGNRALGPAGPAA